MRQTIDVQLRPHVLARSSPRATKVGVGCLRLPEFPRRTNMKDRERIIRFLLLEGKLVMSGRGSPKGDGRQEWQ